MTISDIQLTRDVKAGDDRAFEMIVERHKDGLVNYLTLLTGHRDRGEEYAQDALVRLYQSIHRHGELENLSSYLFSIGTNLVRTDFRRATRWKLLLPWLTRSEASEESPQKAMLQNEVQHQVQAALSSLPLRYRAPLLLREIEGWSYAEIAKSIGCPEGTLKSRIARGRELLRKKLNSYWNGGHLYGQRDQSASSLPAANKSV